MQSHGFLLLLYRQYSHLLESPWLRLTQLFFPGKRVQTATIQAFLAKYDFNQNTHRSIVIAPIRYGRWEFTSPYTMQGEGQILTFLKNWRTKLDAGLWLLRIYCSILGTILPWNNKHLFSPRHYI
jgi:hypothetical protein